MEITEEIKQTIVKINDFIQENNNVNYKIRLLEREVPNLPSLVKKLTIPVVVKQSEIKDKNGVEVKEEDTREFTIALVIERLKKVQKYDVELIKYDSDCWIDINPCDDEFAKWIKVEGLMKVIEDLENNAV